MKIYRWDTRVRDSYLVFRWEWDSYFHFPLRHLSDTEQGEFGLWWEIRLFGFGGWFSPSYMGIATPLFQVGVAQHVVLSGGDA